MALNNGAPMAAATIIDIRRQGLDESLLKLMLQSLDSGTATVKKMPTLLLYDETGLKLFEEITYLDEYYLTNAEIEALEEHARDIARCIPDGTRLVELGSGNLRKVNILLKALETAKKTVEYYALDLSVAELHRTLSAIPPGTYKYVTAKGLHGTYDDGLAWLTSTRRTGQHSCVLSLGSSIGNFTPEEAATFLHRVAKALEPQDMLVLGVDSCQDSKKVFAAYNDSKGTTEAFYRQGLHHANRLLGYEAFRQNDWRIVGRYDDQRHCHEASYLALANVRINDISIRQGEQIYLETAYKYSSTRLNTLWRQSGLIHRHAWANQKEDYKIHLVYPAGAIFSTKVEDYVSHPVPSLQDWRQLWTAWDTVTLGMTPETEFASKPIELRNDLIFYLGHIPAFCDIHISKATGSQNIEPTAYVDIFERGIDPDVDDPALCHDHSRIPESWPHVKDILDYQQRARERVTSLITTGQAYSQSSLGRSLWLAFEHEAMHLETYLYMLLQSPETKPPPGEVQPDFAKLDAQAEEAMVPNEWFKIAGAQLMIGLHDPEDGVGREGYFGWDNEKPERMVSVAEFETQARPISNGEYATFLTKTSRYSLPASWTTTAPDPSKTAPTNGSHHAMTSPNEVYNDAVEEKNEESGSHFLTSVSIKTVFGLVPLLHARHWPVMASYDELAAYASWAGGRIPTMKEARAIYAQVEAERNKELVEKVPSSLISAVNGHLSNNGVQETPPSSPYKLGDNIGSGTQAAPGSSLNPYSLFADLTSPTQNVAFKNWHPTAVTPHGDRLCGQAEFGGVWEWTSTSLSKWDGFEAMPSYPGYTADFFDGKHNIVVGGSWATHPRIAGRKSFINWYQRNYAFVWAGARLVRDISPAKPPFTDEMRTSA